MQKTKVAFCRLSSNTAFTTNRRRRNVDPSFLATLTMIGVNKKAYTPTVADIKDMLQAVLQQGRRGRPTDAEEGRWWRRVIHQSHVSLLVRVKCPQLRMLPRRSKLIMDLNETTPTSQHLRSTLAGLVGRWWVTGPRLRAWTGAAMIVCTPAPPQRFVTLQST